HGLQYLADTDLGTMFPQGVPPEVRAALYDLGGDLLGREQYLDFLTNRSFRQTLMCHADIPLRRQLRPEQVAAFQIAALVEWVSPPPHLNSPTMEQFRGPTGAPVATNHPLTKAALVHLAEIWPRALSFDELQAAARARLGANRLVIQDAARYDQ